MTLLMRDQENIEKGRAEGMIATLIGLVKDGILTVADAAKRANLRTKIVVFSVVYGRILEKIYL